MTPHEKRIASLKKYARPDAKQHITDPDYARALIGATGLSKVALAQTLGVSTSTLRAYTNTGSHPTELPYVVQHALETIVVSNSQESPCTPASSRKPHPRLRSRK